MLVTGIILWVSLLKGAWPATPIQDQLPATPRVRLSFKGKGLLCSSLKPSFLLRVTEERSTHKDGLQSLGVSWASMKREAGLAGKGWDPRTQTSRERVLSWALDSLSSGR